MSDDLITHNRRLIEDLSVDNLSEIANFKIRYTCWSSGAYNQQIGL